MIIKKNEVKIIKYIFTVKNNREEGFHLDLEDFLMGLLQLAGELVS